MAQFKGQRNFLIKIKQNVIYLGSPLLNLKFKKKNFYKKSINKYFISPSYREDLSLLQKKLNLLKDYKIFLKSILFNDRLTVKNLPSNFYLVKRIKIDNFEKNILGIIVSINSSIRGSGWFNEAISRGIPIIILSKKTRKLFIETFPNYPHIFLDNIKNINHLKKEIKRIKKFKSKKYLIKHNRKFRDLLESQI